MVCLWLWKHPCQCSLHKQAVFCLERHPFVWNVMVFYSTCGTSAVQSPLEAATLSISAEPLSPGVCAIHQCNPQQNESHIILIPKTIGNREGDCVRKVVRGDKHNLRKSANRKAQISVIPSTHWHHRISILVESPLLTIACACTCTCLDHDERSHDQFEIPFHQTASCSFLPGWVSRQRKRTDWKDFHHTPHQPKPFLWSKCPLLWSKGLLKMSFSLELRGSAGWPAFCAA